LKIGQYLYSQKAQLEFWKLLINLTVSFDLPRWCLHLIVVGGLECLNDSTGHAGGSLATGRVSQAGRAEKERPD